MHGMKNDEMVETMMYRTTMNQSD